MKPTEAAETIAAARALQAAGLTNSEAIDVIRGARQLPGPVAANLPIALDVFGTEAAIQASLYRRAANLLRQAGTMADDLTVTV